MRDLPIRWFPVEAGRNWHFPLLFSRVWVFTAAYLVPPVRQVPDAGIKKRERFLFL